MNKISTRKQIMTSSESTSEYSDSETEVSIKVRKETWLQHASPKQKYRCPNCTKCYSHKKMYWQHLRSHLQYHPHECKVCLECFSQKELLQAHKETHTNKKNYTCSDCPKTFSHVSALNRHRLKHGEKPPYPCPICKEEFPTVSSRSRHVKNHIVSCALCEVDFRDYTQLIHHIASVHRLQSAQDEGAGPAYITPLSVDRNTDGEEMMDLGSGHENNRPKDFTCFVCEQGFSSEQSMTTHLKSHRLSMCSHCPQFFADKSTLRDHEFTHTGKHPYMCNACQGIFRSAKLLKYHQKRCKFGSFPNQSPNDLRAIMDTINNAVDISSDVKAKVESAIKTVLSINTAAKETEPSVATQSLLKQIDPCAIANLSSENTPAPQDVVSLQKVSMVLTRDLDESSTPSIDFTNLFHCYWLIRFLEGLRTNRYPLEKELFWKIHHINTRLVEQMGKFNTTTASDKDNFLFLNCLQKKLNIILGSHFDSLVHKLS